MSTTGLELKNYLNLKFNWKKVSKVRNTTRRPASKMLKLGQPGNRNSPKGIEVPEFPEYEKPQRSASQRRLSASIEHVPIKKRRFLLRSPSPPSQSPHPNDFKEVGDERSHSDWQTSMDSVEKEQENRELLSSSSAGAIQSLSGKFLKCTSEVRCHNEDFSGIAMLADAACNDSLENSANIPRNVSVGVLVQLQDGSASSLNRFGDTVSSQISDRFAEVQDQSAIVAYRDETIESLVTSDTVENVHCNTEDSMALLSNDFSESNDTAKTAEEDKRSSGGLRDGRWHWDLNVVMDEWEEPLEDETVASGLNNRESRILNCLQTQNLDSAGCSDMHDESEKVENANELALLPSLSQLSKDEMLSNVGLSSLVSDAEEHGLDGLSGSERSFLKDDCVSSSVGIHAPETSLLLDSKVHEHMDTRMSDINYNLHLQLDDSKAQGSADNQKKDAARNSIEAINGCSVSSVHVVQSVEVKDEPYDFSCQREEPCPFVVEKREPAFLHGSVVGEASKEPNAALNRDDVYHGEKGDISYSENEFGNVSYQTAEPDAVAGDTIVTKLETISDSVCNPEDMGLLFVAAGSEPPFRDGGLKETIERSPVINPFKISMSEDYTANQEVQIPVHSPANNLGKFHSEESLDGDPDSHVSHEDCGGCGNVNDVEGGYDSYLEDGELREPVGPFWVENEGEEAEHVDYDSDNRDGCDTADATNEPVLSLGKVLGGVENDHRSLSDQCNYMDDQPTSEKSNTPDGHHEVFETEIKAGRKATDGSASLNKNEIDTSEIVGDSSAETVGGTTPKGELLPWMDLSVSSDKKDADSIRRSSSNNSASMRDGDEMQTGSDESMGKGRSSLQLDGRDGSSNYGVKSDVTNFAAGNGDGIMASPDDDASPGVRKSTIISTSKSGYPHLMRKGGTAERDDTYAMGKAKQRDVSPGNAFQGRFERYIGINNRGYRGGYRRPRIYENANTADAMHNHFVRRERSFSPIFNRPDHLPQGHRRSRSRSKSRSPDFRTDARGGRMRISYHQNNHAAAADHMRGRRSPPGRLFIQGQRFDHAMDSPGRLRGDDCPRPMVRPPPVRYSDINSSGRSYEYDEGEDFKRKPHLPRSHRRSRSRSRTRSPEFRSEGRMGAMRVPYQPRAGNHIRDRRSPVGAFRPGQRFDPTVSSGGGRMGPDDYVRPIMRPVRFSDASQSGQGNNEYENDEFRRKPRKVFERIHPMRHYEMAGEVRRFQYDAAEDNNNDMPQNFRSTDRRSGDVLRSGREERGSTRYNSDRVYYSGPKSMGIRDFGDDAHPRPVRP
ncbi:hypothetical protein Dimus_028223 [Dionaea muscipula]